MFKRYCSRWFFCSLILGFLATPPAFSWGRHDLITKFALESSSQLRQLESVAVKPEPIESAAPDLLKRVVPGLLSWCERYHTEFDKRYDWTAPSERKLSPREALLWALEDNIDTSLKVGHERNAAEVLIGYVSEPDGILDGGLDQSPYIERLRTSMSYFYGSDAQTHAFRHYYVPSSGIPPILWPKGIAPYRAELYAELARGAFRTGHPYWGFRFLAWSIHYIQDVTQPWHTELLPNFSFLSFSKAEMKKEVSALHYLTEAFADSWMLRQSAVPSASRLLASHEEGPWYVSRLAIRLAERAHRGASDLADHARSFFAPIVAKLGFDLKPIPSRIEIGGLSLPTALLNFDGQGTGATAFLSPLWKPSFLAYSERDQLMILIETELESAISGTQKVVSYVLLPSRY